MNVFSQNKVEPNNIGKCYTIAEKDYIIHIFNRAGKVMPPLLVDAYKIVPDFTIFHSHIHITSIAQAIFQSIYLYISGYSKHLSITFVVVTGNYHIYFILCE